MGVQTSSSINSSGLQNSPYSKRGAIYSIHTYEETPYVKPDNVMVLSELITSTQQLIRITDIS
jgi:hypothetical protein